MLNGDSSDLGRFDRFSSAVGQVVSQAWFFMACVLMIAVWLPSFFLFRDSDSWQLAVNSPTTVITFILVALLQNTQRRADIAVQEKLNAIADGLADLMDELTADHGDLRTDSADLRAAVGLEGRVSSTKTTSPST
jgi:low affinity Fe/Cu permease